MAPSALTHAGVTERVSKQAAGVHSQVSTRLLWHQRSANTGCAAGEAAGGYCCHGVRLQHLELLRAVSGLGSVYPAGLGRRCCSLWTALWNYLRMLLSLARLCLVLPMFACALGLLQRGYPSISPHGEQKMVFALSSWHRLGFVGWALLGAPFVLWTMHCSSGLAAGCRSALVHQEHQT